MSFRKSPAGMQTSLLGYYHQLSDSKREKMEQSMEASFHSLVVARINESPFAALYCPENGAPNKPIRQLIGANVLMHKKGWTTRELFDNIDFNMLTMRALGIAEEAQRPFCRATFFKFQERLAQHRLETGENLLQQVFDHLTAEQMQELEIKGKIQRCDSFQAMSNIVSYTRVKLLVEVLIRLHRVLEQQDCQRLAELLDPYIEQDSGRYVYDLEQAQLPKELQKLGEVYLKLHEALRDDYGDTEIFRIFERLFQEHFTTVEESGRVEVRPPEDIPSDSLQSPDDREATYREKRGENYRGQVVNVTETADPEDPANLITDVTTAPNNTDDAKMLEERIDPIKEKTPELEELHTDATFGNEETDKKLDEAGVRHVVTAIRGRRSEVRIDIEQEGESYRVSCPQQSVMAARTRTRWKACFDLEVCRSCPQAEGCPTSELKSSRTFYFEHADYLARQRWRSIEKIPPERRKIRPNIEATVKEFTKPFNHKGKLPYRGRFRTELYALSMAIAINCGRVWRHKRDNEDQETEEHAHRSTTQGNGGTMGARWRFPHKVSQSWAAVLVLMQLFHRSRRSVPSVRTTSRTPTSF